MTHMTPPGWTLTRYGPVHSDSGLPESQPVIRPGDREWFTNTDWHPISFVVLDGTDLWIPMISAEKTEHGAFSRLLDHAENEGWRVHVVTPFDLMVSILNRRGFTPTLHTTPAGNAEVWTSPWPA